RLGGTITRGDGSFVIKGQPNCFAQKVDVRSKILELRKHVHSRYRRFFDFLCKALSASSEQIALRVLDVGGRQLAAKSLRVWGASLNRRVMLAVPSEALREHEARLVKLDGAERSFLPVPEMVESILRAVPLVAPPGSLDFERFQQVAMCPIAPFRQMDELYRDAFGVLGGDPWAAR